MAHAEDCKSFYTGSIPVPTSKKIKKRTCLFIKNCVLFFCCRFWRSSAVELSAVNRSVVGSNPTARANKKTPLQKQGCFFVFRSLIRHYEEQCDVALLSRQVDARPKTPRLPRRFTPRNEVKRETDYLPPNLLERISNHAIPSSSYTMSPSSPLRTLF